MKVELNQKFFHGYISRNVFTKKPRSFLRNDVCRSSSVMSGGNAKRDSVNSKLKSDKFFLRLHCLECVSEETKSVLAGM